MWIKISTEPTAFTGENFSKRREKVKDLDTCWGALPIGGQPCLSPYFKDQGRSPKRPPGTPQKAWLNSRHLPLASGSFLKFHLHSAFTGTRKASSVIHPRSRSSYLGCHSPPLKLAGSPSPMVLAYREKSGPRRSSAACSRSSLSGTDCSSDCRARSSSSGASSRETSSAAPAPGRHDAPSRQSSPVSLPLPPSAARFFEPREIFPARPPSLRLGWAQRPGRTNSVAQRPGRARSGGAKSRAETGALWGCRWLQSQPCVIVGAALWARGFGLLASLHWRAKAGSVSGMEWWEWEPTEG